MNKKLTAKIQKLVPILTENETGFSTSLAIEPTERDLILKKGSVYTVFDINSPVELNVSLICKVINDVLFDSYYHSDNISPIQSLEKAIVDINEKITNLAVQEQTVKGKQPVSDQKVTFNILAGVLWGNVLYIVQYGNAKSFLMREGEINKVSSTSEGNFSVASGVVKDDDVIVLCSENFSNKYPPDKLLDTSLSSNDLEHNQSCMILKFMVDTEFTEDEVIDFSLKKDKKMPKVSSMLEGIKKMTAKKETKDKPIATLAGAVGDAPTEKQNNPPNIKLKSHMGPRYKITSKSLLVVVLLLLGISMGATIILRNRGDKDEQIQTGEQEEGDTTTLTVPKEFNKPESETPKKQPQPEKQLEEPVPPVPEKEEPDSLERVAAQPFYDIKLADETANPTDIALFNNTVVVTDTTSGKIFTSDLDTPKFTALENTFPGIKSAVNYDGKLNFADDAGYKAYDLINKTVSESYAGDFGTSGRYLGNIYSSEGATLVKYVTSGDELTSSTWGEGAEFSNAKAISISYSVYLISGDGTLSVFTQGEKTDFEISGLDKPLSNPSDIITSTAFDNIYVADKGNSRVLVLTTEGKLVRQLKAEKDADWNDIRSISVNSNETKMFLLSGSKVFELDLP